MLTEMLARSLSDEQARQFAHPDTLTRKELRERRKAEAATATRHKR